MRTHQIKGFDRPVSVLALGTQAFGTSITVEESFKMLDLYAGLGGNFLDTARVYGYFAENVQGISETVLGWWMKARGNRSEMIVGTKGAHPPLGQMHSPRLDRQSIRSDIEQSLRALDTDYIDIYWLHRDDPARPVEEILETLGELVREGKALRVGASNWSLARLEQAQAIAQEKGLQGFAAVQPQWSLARQELLEDNTLVRMDEAEYAWHKRTGLPVVPFTSQAKGFYYKLAAGGEQALSKKAKERFLSPRNLRSYELLCRYSERTGHSVGALSIAYLTGQPFPVCPIVGFSGLEQARSMQEAGEIELDAAFLAELNASSEIER
ncbi:MAG: aldo/keto reductase [Eubacteriales bacterium]|nr:aldo/keto reductase [Eubacteriales bacterium]